MSDVMHKKLVELNCETNNAIIVTVLVLAKTEPKIFLAKDSNEYRGVVTYTVRDSKRHIVNCKYWGSKEKVEEYHCKIKIGDVIDVVRPKVMPQMNTASSQLGHLSTFETFQPISTLPISLVLNEGQGFLKKHHREHSNLDLYHELRNLLHVSHKPLIGALNLADVRCSTNDRSNQGPFVDLLVVVAVLRPVKELKSSRSGQMLNCLELIVFDCSLSDGMVLTIWNSEWIKRAQQYWQAKRTVLHLIDVKVSYSEFYKCSALSFTGRTLVYENPIGKQAEILREFAATAPSNEFAQTGAGNLPEPHQITTQMTVKQIYARAERGYLNDDSEQFTAVLFALVTKFDIDGQSLILSRKCKSCQRLLRSNQAICDSDQCHLAFSMNYSGEKFEQFFNINLHLSDHTGTIEETRLTGSVAERILKLKVEDYLLLQEKQKEQLKWLHLFSHFEVKLVVKKANAVRRNLAVIVVDMRPIQLEEISQKMLVF